MSSSSRKKPQQHSLRRFRIQRNLYLHLPHLVPINHALTAFHRRQLLEDITEGLLQLRPPDLAAQEDAWAVV